MEQTYTEIVLASREAELSISTRDSKHACVYAGSAEGKLSRNVCCCPSEGGMSGDKASVGGHNSDNWVLTLLIVDA